jgi:exodeoxyribonuclease VII small subunit
MTMKANYQELKQQLDDILAKLQDEEVDVDEAVKLYKQGQKVVTELEAYLTQTKQQLKLPKK